MTRFVKVAAVAATAALLALAGCSSSPPAESTGEITEVTVTVQGMRYIPDVIEVPRGDELVITFENTGNEMHDLVFLNGAHSERVGPGVSEVIEVGVITEEMEGWCTVGNHREMGMELTVVPIDG